MSKKTDQITALQIENRNLKKQLELINEELTKQITFKHHKFRENIDLSKEIKALTQEINRLTEKLTATQERENVYYLQFKRLGLIEYEYNQFNALLIEHLLHWDKIEYVSYPTLPIDIESKDIFSLFYLYWQFWMAEHNFYSAQFPIKEDYVPDDSDPFEDLSVKLRLALKDNIIAKKDEMIIYLNTNIKEITKTFLKSEKSKSRRINYFKIAIQQLQADNQALEETVNTLESGLLDREKRRRKHVGYSLERGFWQRESYHRESDQDYELAPTCQ